jgi:mannose-6-phosphate isomerase-like protein (cupin superfamily)
LENIGKIPLELIEVQTGSYLGEDDIVRFDDIYGRNEQGPHNKVVR